jgi:hypothetical protein
MHDTWQHFQLNNLYTTEVNSKYFTNKVEVKDDDAFVKSQQSIQLKI